MTFVPSYRCDGVTCVEETRAQTDSELTLEGWLILAYSESRDPDEHEDEQADFCSPECLRGWLAENRGGDTW